MAIAAVDKLANDINKLIQFINYLLLDMIRTLSIAKKCRTTERVSNYKNDDCGDFRMAVESDNCRVAILEWQL